MLILPFLLQLAVDDRVRVEAEATCARRPAAERAACVDAQLQAAGRTFAAANIGDDTTPAAIGRCLESSRKDGAIDWTLAAACAHDYARAHPAE
jgi:hypothetical protein